MSAFKLPFPQRLDFGMIKHQVSIIDVLGARGLLDGLHRRGNRWTGPCPIHRGDNTTAFVVDGTKNLWYCFSGCARGGDVIELVRLLDGVDVRAAAVHLAGMPPSAPMPPTPRRAAFRPFVQTLYVEAESPFLLDKGISPATARAYEAGAWRGRGMLAGCVAVRLHTPTGSPLGYAGRRLTGEGSKWTFPNSFPKNDILYGHHRVDPFAPQLVVVECPWGVMRLAQIGVPAVALLGTALSERQAELLSSRARIVLLLDGDAAGRRGALGAARRLEVGVDVVIATLPAGKDPDDLSDEDLGRLVG